MKLGFAISGKRSARDAVEVARRVESAGLEEVWITEDYFERGAFALAGAVLTATSQIRLGIGVINPFTRHPVLTAMEAAALAELAPGRLLLGLGASNERWMQHQLGIPFEKPLRRLEESIQILRPALRGERVQHDGLTGSVDAQLAFSASDVPIILGVKGPRALDLAGRVSDGVLLSILSSPAYVAWASRRLGGSLPYGIGGYVVVRREDDRAAARETLRPFVAYYLGVHGDHAITREAGIEPGLAARFREGLLAGQPRTDLVTEEHLDTFVAAGDRDDIIAALGRYADAGLGTAVVFDQVDQQLDQVLDDVSLAAKALGP